MVQTCTSKGTTVGCVGADEGSGGTPSSGAVEGAAGVTAAASGVGRDDTGEPGVTGTEALSVCTPTSPVPTQRAQTLEPVVEAPPMNAPQQAANVRSSPRGNRATTGLAQGCAGTEPVVADRC